MIKNLNKTIFKMMGLLASSRYRWSSGIFLTLYRFAKNIKYNYISKRLLNQTCVTKKLEFKVEGNAVTSKVSVVIPVCNSGERLTRLLAAIQRQKKVKDIEIIVIDSGSTDDTVEAARRFGCKVTEIPRGEFNHGSTRQLAINKAGGEFIVFTVDDMLPVDDYWLYNMVTCLIDNPELSVVSVRQLTNPSADLYSKWIHDSTYKAYGLTEDMEYLLKAPDSFYRLPCNIKRKVSFVDNVCACYRGDVVRKFGFHTMPIGEDIDIGARLAMAGAHSGFLNSTGVYHWHHNTPDYFLKRGFSSVRPFVELLGHEIIDFELFNIHSFEDIRIRSATLYHTIRLALKQWDVTGELLPADMRNFIDILSGVAWNFSNKYKHGEEDGENQPLKALLDNLYCRILDTGLQNRVSRNNYMFLEMRSQLASLIKYISDNDETLKVRKGDFSDALFKITASVIGVAIGLWFAKLKKEGKLVEISNDIEKMLAKDVCYR